MPFSGDTDERPSRVYKKSRRYVAELARLGANIRRLRQERGWTLEYAAERSSLDLKHLQKVEQGVLNVTMVTLVRLADGFDVPLKALFATTARGGGSRQRRPAAST